MDLIKTLTANYMKPELPQMNVGDTVRVTLRVKEGSRERTQVFEGTIIARKHGGINETTGKLVVDAGADVLVAGNYVFGAADPRQAISTLYNLK